jgi:hypothetical protein
MFEDAEVIYSYTREQALEDGVLIDVSETAKEAGFKYPVAVTAGVWADIIEPDAIATKHGESKSGRLWDVLWLLYVAIKMGRSAGDITTYKLIASAGGRQHIRYLKGQCSAGDNGEPVITIMLPNED